MKSDKESFLYMSLAKDELNKKVIIKLKSRLFMHFPIESVKKCTDCGTFLPSSHLRISDQQIVEKLQLLHTGTIENLTI